MARRIAWAPWLTVAHGTRPTVPSVWRDRTRARDWHRASALAGDVPCRSRSATPWPTNKMALVDGAVVRREGGAGQSEPGTLTRINQRVRHRADIAGVGAVEGRAIFLEELLAPGRLQPSQCGKTLTLSASATGDVRDFSATTTASASSGACPCGPPGPSPGTPINLHGPHAAAHQSGREVCRAREIIGDATKDHATHSLHETGDACVGQSGNSCPVRNAAFAISARRSPDRR